MVCMAASCQSEMFPPSQCLMGNRWKVDLSRLLPMSSPETWAASSKFIGEPEHDQDLIVSDIQTSRPFEVWLNTSRSRIGDNWSVCPNKCWNDHWRAGPHQIPDLMTVDSVEYRNSILVNCTVDHFISTSGHSGGPICSLI
jgi:hypothetical protein